MIENHSNNYEAFHIVPRCNICKTLLNPTYLQCVELIVESNASNFWKRVFEEWKSNTIK